MPDGVLGNPIGYMGTSLSSTFDMPVISLTL